VVNAGGAREPLAKARRSPRPRGRLRGEQPKLSPTQKAHLVKLYRGGEHTVSELEQLFHVTRSTIYRAVARADRRAALAPADDTAT
jgi:DNA-binding MarR family transcriptional regulator